MIRITGGRFKGRSIQTPEGDATRPTLSKVRQALFNSIQFEIADARVLDLFSGSGAIGLEALSRGASWVDFYDSSDKAVKVLKKNQADFKVEEETAIYTKSVETFWTNPRELDPYDFVFADPPYQKGWEMKLLEQFPWKKLLKVGGMFVVEWSDRKLELPDETESLKKVREQNYGDSWLTNYRRKES